MGMGQLANQAMGAQQAQCAADAGGAAARGLFVLRWARIEVLAEVAVAESGDGPLAPAQGAEQGGIAAQRMESAVTLAVAGEGAAKGGGQLTQRRADLCTGQRVQIAPVGRSTDLGPTRQIADGSAQGPPSALGFGLGHRTVGPQASVGRQALRWGGPLGAGSGWQWRRRRRCRLGAEDREGLGPVERVFHAQQVLEFVIGLLAVEAGQMLDADPFMAGEHVAPDLALEAGVHAPGLGGHRMAQEAHHVRALEGEQAVDDKGAIEAGQVFGVVEEQVGSVFTLGGGPVVEEPGKGLENLLPQRVGGCQQAVEQFQPVGLMLRVGQCLGLDGVWPPVRSCRKSAGSKLRPDA